MGAVGFQPLDVMEILRTPVDVRVADREYDECLLLNTLGVTISRGSIVIIDLVNKNAAGAPFKVAANVAQSSVGYSVVALQDVLNNTSGRFLLRGRCNVLAGEVVAALIPMVANGAGLAIQALTGKKPVFLPEVATQVGILGVGFFDGYAGVGQQAISQLSVTTSVNIGNMTAGGTAGAVVDTIVAAVGPGFVVGDAIVAVPPITLEAGVTFNAWVSAANQITLRSANSTNAAIDPAAANWTFKRIG